MLKAITLLICTKAVGSNGLFVFNVGLYQFALVTGVILSGCVIT